MSSNKYNWLIVVEGQTDIDTYKYLFREFGVEENKYFIFPAEGKGNVCKTNNWNKTQYKSQNLMETVKNDVTRIGFCGIILVVDTDEHSNFSFEEYERNNELKDKYVNVTKPAIVPRGGYLKLDSLKGTNLEIPILGICVPHARNGCLETELLESFGFPIKGQDDYAKFVNLIKKTSGHWNIPPKSGGGNWWDENEKAKMDKFVYISLFVGFNACCEQHPKVPSEPPVITNIKSAMKAI